jgi:signal transduction histidine kinase
VNVSALLARLVEEVRPSLEERPVEFVGLDEPLIVTGDALRLEQVVQNLLQNAVKYSAHPSPIQIVVSQQKGWARVAVTDQGIGIPAANVPSLFQRFYRADNVDPRQVSGTGIGLYVVKEIVMLHGGTVEVASVEGQGSTFTVVLPLANTSIGERETKGL